MGFLDKVKNQAEQVAKQGQEKFSEVQAKRSADSLLKELGAWYLATQTGRDAGQGEAQMTRLVGELQVHEAEHGPLEGVGPAPEPPAATEPPAAAAEPPTPSDRPAPPTPPAAPPTPPFGN